MLRLISCGLAVAGGALDSKGLADFVFLESRKCTESSKLVLIYFLMPIHIRTEESLRTFYGWQVVLLPMCGNGSYCIRLVLFLLEHRNFCLNVKGEQKSRKLTRKCDFTCYCMC